MTDIGIDNRRHSFFIVDNEAIDNYELNPQAGWLYIVILRHINNHTRIAFPSLATLAKKTKMSKVTVIKYLKELEERGMIEITTTVDPKTGSNKSNHYKTMPLVKEVYKGSEEGEQGVVKEVYTNNTNSKQDTPNNTQKSKDRLTVPVETKSTPQQILFGAVCWALGIDPQYVTDSRKSTIGKAAAAMGKRNAKPEQMVDYMKWLKTELAWKQTISERDMETKWGEYATLQDRINNPVIIDCDTPEDIERRRQAAGGWETQSPETVKKLKEVMAAMEASKSCQ